MGIFQSATNFVRNAVSGQPEAFRVMRPFLRPLGLRITSETERALTLSADANGQRPKRMLSIIPSHPGVGSIIAWCETRLSVSSFERVATSLVSDCHSIYHWMVVETDGLYGLGAEMNVLLRGLDEDLFKYIGNTLIDATLRFDAFASGNELRG